jgi:molybdenum cofactor guanylyltransferase
VVRTAGEGKKIPRPDNGASIPLKSSDRTNLSKHRHCTNAIAALRHDMSHTLPISGYILAGGRSSRMGRDKALISLAGRPLIEHAVIKLLRICANADILSNDDALASFAPVVPDIHPNCGPIGGIEAALAHSCHDWNLFLPVDMPLLPTALLSHWIADALDRAFPGRGRPGIRIFTAGGRPQPGLCMIHRAVASLISRAVDREEFALISVFEEVGREGPHSFMSESLPDLNLLASAASTEPWDKLTEAQLAGQPLWFLNVNTKQDLAIVQAHIDALDT